MIKMYDLLKEQPDDEPEENPPAYDREEPEMEPEQTPKQEPNKYDDKFEFEMVLDSVEKDLHRFTQDNVEYRVAVSSSEITNGNLRILPDVVINNNSQVSPYIIYDIFVHTYNVCVKKGLHLFSNKAINDSKLSITLPDIEIKYGDRTYENGTFLFSLREILPQERIDLLQTKFDMKSLFGHGATPEENIFNVPKQEVKSFDDLNSFQKQAIRNTLIIPYETIPEFDKNFNVYRDRAIKRGKSILMALSKGTYEGKPYTLHNKKPSIYLWSANKHDSDNAESSVNKQNKTIMPNFTIVIGNARIETYDGKPADELAESNWEEYYKILKFIKEKFKRYNIHFG